MCLLSEGHKAAYVHINVHNCICIDVLLNTCRYANNFRPYRQGDAHELMRCILDAIRMEEIEVRCYDSNNLVSFVMYHNILLESKTRNKNRIYRK